MLRNIAEIEPRRPSTIRRQINDEVETIVLKALAKEKDRRYQSAENLAKDIEHYLTGEPIEAKRDSGWYVLRKALRRYRIPASIAAAFVVVLVLFSGALWKQYQAESRARVAEAVARGSEAEQRKLAEANAAKSKKNETKARDSEERAKRIQEFLQDMLASVDPDKAKGVDVTVREVVDSETDPYTKAVTVFGDAGKNLCRIWRV